jgi:hypothetical protein
MEESIYSLEGLGKVEIELFQGFVRENCEGRHAAHSFC